MAIWWRAHPTQDHCALLCFSCLGFQVSLISKCIILRPARVRVGSPKDPWLWLTQGPSCWMVYSSYALFSGLLNSTALTSGNRLGKQVTSHSCKNTLSIHPLQEEFLEKISSWRQNNPGHLPGKQRADPRTQSPRWEVKSVFAWRHKEEVSISEPCFKKTTDFDQTLLGVTQKPAAASTMLLTTGSWVNTNLTLPQSPGRGGLSDDSECSFQIGKKGVPPLSHTPGWMRALQGTVIFAAFRGRQTLILLSDTLTSFSVLIIYFYSWRLFFLHVFSEIWSDPPTTPHQLPSPSQYIPA